MYFRSTLLALSLFLASSATAAPLNFDHQGRLHDSLGLPLDGAHDLDFTIWDASASGTALWTESHSAVSFSQGYYHVSLSAQELATYAENDDLWLSLTVDSGAELPRIKLASVPFALVAGQAMGVAAGGTVDTTELLINGTTVIAPDGTIDFSHLANVPQDTLTGLNCSAAGDIAEWDGANWGCVAQVHEAADITTGTLDIARLPIGTGSTDVAVGDHRHDAIYLAQTDMSVPDAATLTGGGDADSLHSHGAYATGSDISTAISAAASNYATPNDVSAAVAGANYATPAEVSTAVANANYATPAEVSTAVANANYTTPAEVSTAVTAATARLAQMVGADNLLTNGSFELWSRASQPDGWFLSGGALAAETTEVNAGSRSIQFTAAAADNFAFATIDNFSEYAGQTVTFAVDIDDGGLGATIEIDDGVGSSTTDYSGSGWRRVIVTHTLASNATKLGVRVIAGGGGVMYIDAATLVFGDHPAVSYVPESEYDNRQRSMAFYEHHDHYNYGNDHSENDNWVQEHRAYKAAGTLTSTITNFNMSIWTGAYTGGITTYNTMNASSYNCAISAERRSEVEVHCEVGGAWQTNSTYGVRLRWNTWVNQSW